MRTGKENGLLMPTTTGTTGQVLVSSGTSGVSWGNALSVAGNSGELQFNSGSNTLSSSTYIKAENGYLRLANGLPSTAASGGIIMGSKEIAGRMIPAWVDSSGLDCTAQSNFGRNRIVRLNPVVNVATPTLDGISIATAQTATARAMSATNLYSSVARYSVVGSTNLSGSIAGWRTANLQWWRGSVSKAGGFFYSHTFGISNASAQANGRAFVGLMGSNSAPSNVEPTTLVNCIGMTRLNSSTNWSIYGSDASAPGSVIVDLGSNFPANTVSTDLYRLTLYCPPNSTYVNWRVERVNVADSTTGFPIAVSGTITDSNLLPVNSVFLAAQSWVSTGTLTGSAVFDTFNFYMETDT